MAWPIISVPFSRELILLVLSKTTLNLTWCGSQHNSNVTICCVIFFTDSHIFYLSFFPLFKKKKKKMYPISFALLKEGQNHISLLSSQRKLF